jgi:hypothetical protein
MPYRPDDVAKVDRLIAAINRLKPEFSIHVGDIKPGSAPCEKGALEKAFAQINTLAQPVVYSIGDNEWTDCHRSVKSLRPSESLGEVRKLAFSRPGWSLGKRPMKVRSQANLMPQFATFVENQRFSKKGVVFIIPHVVGSQNGLDSPDPAAVQEFTARSAANVAWINDGFRVAAQTGARAVVIAFQANPYNRPKGQDSGIGRGFIATVEAITKGARAFGKPVLVVHGDNHVLELESFKDAAQEPKAVQNTLRLQLFGDDLVHAMRIVVDPDTPGVFSFRPLIVPENGPF